MIDDDDVEEESRVSNQEPRRVSTRNRLDSGRIAWSSMLQCDDQRLCGPTDRTRCGATLRAGPRDGAQDAALPRASRVSLHGSRSGVRNWTASRGSSTRCCATDQHRPTKQRHTCQAHLRVVTGGERLHGRLHDRCKDYVRAKRLGGQEPFATAVFAARLPLLRHDVHGAGRYALPPPPRSNFATCCLT